MDCPKCGYGGLDEEVPEGCRYLNEGMDPMYIRKTIRCPDCKTLIYLDEVMVWAGTDVLDEDEVALESKRVRPNVPRAMEKGEVA